MPVFRTTPSSDLLGSIRRAMASANLGPAAEMQADVAAAGAARNLTLADKARAEVEAMRNAEAQRNDPKLATQYAANVAGLDLPAASRLENHIRGVLEQPTSNDDLDASMVGKEAQPFVTGEPVLEPGQRRLFQSAHAALLANRLATGKTSADQLAHAGERVNETALTNEAANAPDVPTGNRIIAAIAKKAREPFKVSPQGVVLNEETGSANEETRLAQAVRALSAARSGQASEAARASAALADQRSQETRSGVRIGAPVLVNDPETGPVYTSPSAAVGRSPAAKPVTATVAPPSDQPTESLPGGTGTHLMQEADTGTKYAVNDKTGRAWKATDKGWEPTLVTNLPKNLSKFGTGSATQSSREAIFTQRVITSANQATKDLANVVQLPITASTGVFGGRKQGPGLLDAGREVLANKMTSEEAQEYNAMSAGFQRTLASIEAAGLMPSGQLTHQMDAVQFKEGDTNLTKLHKLAQTRQIIESGMEVVLDNPRVSEPEKARARQIIASVQKAVPFTHEDLIQLKKAQAIDSNATMASVLKARGGATAAAPAATNAKGWKLMEDAKGNKAYVSPDGKQFEELK